MTALLDSHAFLWFITGSAKLSSTARSVIEEQSQPRLLSVVSLWEIAIKQSLGRLTLAGPFNKGPFITVEHQWYLICWQSNLTILM